MPGDSSIHPCGPPCTGRRVWHSTTPSPLIIGRSPPLRRCGSPSGPRSVFGLATSRVFPCSTRPVETGRARASSSVGAARVVGVDVSEQMIALARQKEQAQPLGIEYHVAHAATLGKIGEFDRVSAAYTGWGICVCSPERAFTRRGGENGEPRRMQSLRGSSAHRLIGSSAPPREGVFVRLHIQSQSLAGPLHQRAPCHRTRRLPGRNLREPFFRVPAESVGPPRGVKRSF